MGGEESKPNDESDKQNDDEQARKDEMKSGVIAALRFRSHNLGGEILCGCTNIKGNNNNMAGRMCVLGAGMGSIQGQGFMFGLYRALVE